MYRVNLSRAFALMATLILMGPISAQPTLQKKDPPLSADDVVGRIMAYDKNNDGKVIKDELPERLHDLLAKGDTNKDGALDKDEIRKLAATLPDAPGGLTVRGGVGIGAGPGAPGLGNVVGVIEDLKLSGKKKDEAQAAAKGHEENVRKLMDRAREDLLQKMKEILSEEELKDFKAALDRPRGAATFINVGPGAARPGDFERRIEQLQKELDELRRQKR